MAVVIGSPGTQLLLILVVDGKRVVFSQGEGGQVVGLDRRRRRSGLICCFTTSASLGDRQSWDRRWMRVCG